MTHTANEATTATRHLLLIALGPVQDFIAQARRTRDLWFGSHLLSEISKATARHLTDNDCTLIFPPWRKGDPKLNPSDAPLDGGGKPAVNVANKILAVVPADQNSSVIALSARVVANRRLVEPADLVRSQLGGAIAPGTEEDWDEQLESMLDFVACWAPLWSDDDYRATRTIVESQLNARKALRNFKPWTKQRQGVPKSSLDGIRTTVLDRPKAGSNLRRLRLSTGEQLDAVGLVKRAGGSQSSSCRFPPSRWRRG